MIIFDGELKTVKLGQIVGEKAVPILRDHFIYNKTWKEITEKYGFEKNVIPQLREQIARYVVYLLRKENYHLTNRHIIFNDEYLKTIVWNEFIHEETTSGKTTQEIATETGHDLKEINKYI